MFTYAVQISIIVFSFIIYMLLKILLKFSVMYIYILEYKAIV